MGRKRAANSPSPSKLAPKKAKPLKGKAKNTQKGKDLITMSQKDWFEMRMTEDPYVSARESFGDGRFWSRKQSDIYNFVIEKKSKEVVEQKYVDFEYLRENEHEFGNVMWKCTSLGVENIMKFKQDYNVEVVKQFYATVFFVKDKPRTLKWMTGNDMFSAPFVDFVKAMDYEEQFETGKGLQCYGSGVPPSKDCLKSMYPKFYKRVGNIVGLRKRYYYFMKLLNVTTCPKAGDLGSVRGHVIQLLYQARHHDGEIDVMQWMYETMRQVVIHRRSLCYGPYIYAFIKYVKTQPLYKQTPVLVDLFPENVTHRPYQPLVKRKESNTNQPKRSTNTEVGESSSGANRNTRGLVNYFTNLWSMCKATNVRVHKMHDLQKKHLREFRADRIQRGFNNVPHDTRGILNESDVDDFDMPPLNEDDFNGFVGIPPPFGMGDNADNNDDELGTTSESSEE